MKRVVSMSLAVLFCGCSAEPQTQRELLGEAEQALTCDPSRSILECDGHCVDVQSSRHDCGGCGNECAPSFLCNVGACVPASGATHDRGGDPAAWYARGPFIGGRLDAIVASPASSSTLVVGTPGGGVWRTTNNGASWTQPLSYALGDYSITHLEWDRGAAGNLFMTTYNGLYATTDLGDHFTALVNSGANPAPLMPLQIAGGPFHTADAYAFTQMVLGGTRIVLYGQPCSGLSYSYNGVSFTQSWPFLGGATNPDNCIQTIAADDTTGYVYFSTMGGSSITAPHLYRSASPWTSTTPSLSWSLANTNLPNGESVNSITQTSVAGGGTTYPNNLAAVVSSSSTSSYKVWTTSNGTSWSQTPGQPTSANWDARVIAYPGSNDLFVGMPIGWQSQSYGGTFSAFPPSSDHADLRAFYFSSAFGYMWDATDGSGYTGTQANITRWSWALGAAISSPATIPVAGVSGWQAYFAEATAAPTASGRRIYTGSQDNEILCSDDQGATWTTNGVPFAGDALTMRYSPASASRAFFITNDGNLQYSNNINAASCAGVTWAAPIAFGGGNPFLWTHAQMAASPSDANKVYIAGAFNHLFAITVGGATNTRTTPANAISVLVDGSGALVIGTLGSGLYRSTNDGVNWSAFGLNASPPAVVLDLTWSSTGGGAGTYFAATTDGLYRLPPGGAWTLVDGGAGYTVSAVAVDPHCATRLYDGFGYASQMGQHRGGIRVSSDSGVTWSSITSGLAIHQAPVSALQVDPSSSRYVYASSFGQGVWVYDYGAAPTCP
jgi:hypothetical protein